MWCPQCQADVPMLASPEAGRLACASCGTEIARATNRPKPSPSPRDLLARWASDDALDGAVPLRRSAPPARPKPVASPAPPVSDSSRTAESAVASQRDVRSRVARFHLPARIGHWLAYGGVVLLGAGSGLVVFDFLGGRDGLALYGWLTCVVAQSLLFVGVITLMIDGLEHSADQLVDRLDALSERLMRIEAAQDAESGPHWEKAVTPARSSGYAARPAATAD